MADEWKIPERDAARIGLLSERGQRFQSEIGALQEKLNGVSNEIAKIFKRNEMVLGTHTVVTEEGNPLDFATVIRTQDGKPAVKGEADAKPPEVAAQPAGPTPADPSTAPPAEPSPKPNGAPGADPPTA